jgi:hypothetical protein
MNQSNLEQEKYYELSYYTLAHDDPRFIHQHIVDAFAAQTANQDTNPIKVAFALIGLYLYLERDYTGTTRSAISFCAFWTKNKFRDEQGYFLQQLMAIKYGPGP